MSSSSIQFDEKLLYVLTRYVPDIDDRVTSLSETCDRFKSYPFNTKKSIHNYSTHKSVEFLLNLLYNENVIQDIGEISDINTDSLLEQLGHEKKTCTYMNDFSFVSRVQNKKYLDMRKAYVHEAFVAQRCLNSLKQEIPNFQYIYQYIDDIDNTLRLNVENVYGTNTTSLYEYITKSDKFNIEELFFIIIQISLAISVAQERYGFMYNSDVNIFNIRLYELSEYTTVYYKTVHGYVELKTKLVPIMTEFTNSNVTVDNIFYTGVDYEGKLNEIVEDGQKFHPISDMFVIFHTCMLYILGYRKTYLSKNIQKQIFDVYDFFIQNNTYIATSNERITIKDPSVLFAEKSRISTFAYTTTKEYPYLLVRHMMKVLPYRFSLSHVKTVGNKYSMGNPRQLFEYLVLVEKDKSFHNFIERLNSCDIPLSDDVVLMYYIASRFENSINGVNMVAMINKHDKKILEAIDKKKKEIFSVFTEKIETLQTDQNSISSHIDKTDLRLALDAGQTVVYYPYTMSEIMRYDNYTDFKQEIHDNIQRVNRFLLRKEIMEYVIGIGGKFKIPDSILGNIINSYRTIMTEKRSVLLNNIANFETYSRYNIKEDLENVFMLRTCPKNISSGIKTNGKFLYILFCGTNREEYTQSHLLLLLNYKDIFEEINVTEINDHNPSIFPVVFQSTIRNDKNLWIYASDDSTLDKKVGSFVYNVSKQEWELKRILPFLETDVSRENYFGDSVETSDKKFISYFEDKKGKSYFEIHDSAIHANTRKFNNFVKSEIIKKFTQKSYVMDIGSGKGQDLLKYVSQRIDTLVCIDNDINAISELVNRKYDIIGNTSIQMETRVLANVINMNDTYLTNIDKINKELSIETYNKSFDYVVCNLAFHYFLKTPESLTNVVRFVDNYIKKNGTFVFTTFDGEKIYNLLSERGEWNVNDRQGNRKYSIRRKYTSGSFENIGQSIDVKLPFSNDYYTEYLVNIKYISSVMSEYGYSMKSNTSFSSFIPKYKNARFLDKDDRTYVDLYHVYEFVKE